MKNLMMKATLAVAMMGMTVVASAQDVKTDVKAKAEKVSSCCQKADNAAKETKSCCQGSKKEGKSCCAKASAKKVKKAAKAAKKSEKAAKKTTDATTGASPKN